MVSRPRFVSPAVKWRRPRARSQRPDRRGAANLFPYRHIGQAPGPAGSAILSTSPLTQIRQQPQAPNQLSMPSAQVGNATPYYGAFRSILGDRLSDAIPASTGTWPADVPALVGTPIDHILFSDPFTMSASGTWNLDGTDHRAVWAELWLGS